MNDALYNELVGVYCSGIQAPFQEGFRKWVETYVELPPAYAIPGRVDLSISPYLLDPCAAIDDPRIMQVNMCGATQIGKTLLSELFLPYAIINLPGPAMRIFQGQDVSDIFTMTRLKPLLEACALVKPLLKYDRYATTKKGITLPHMSIICGSSNTALQHGITIKHLICDELHQWEPGQFAMFEARTTAFSGRRKIICASQPARTGHEWETLCYRGVVKEWSWRCPHCKTLQLFQWSKQRDDESFYGMNWDTILNEDKTTNIDASAETAWMECQVAECRHHVNDTPTERYQLNADGEYQLTKSDGDAQRITFMVPCWVNPNISFKSKVAEYLIARKTKKMTGLDELMEIFVEQSLGKFYKREELEDPFKILTATYEKELDNNWVNTMGVDIQETGDIKYYVVRAWNKNGNESRRLEFGVCRTWEEIDKIRQKYSVFFASVHVDSGDGNRTQEIYQQCIIHGEDIQAPNRMKLYVCFTPTKGDQKPNYKHADGITRLYSPISPQDAGFPGDHRLKGTPAPLVLFSNYGLKTILMNLRDQKIDGVKWLNDEPDSEYDKQMYSEGLTDVVDKKSGLVVKRWIARGANHYLDCEVLCLLAGIRAKVFSAVKVNEDDMKKLAEANKEQKSEN